MVDRRARSTPNVSCPPAEPAAADAGGEDSGDRVIRAIQQFSRSPAHTELAHALYGAGGRELTPAQVDALETLASRREWRMHEFAEALDIDRGAASRTTDRLLKLGLAERRPDEGDRRYVIVQATAAGRRISRRIQRDRYALMQEVLSGLSGRRRSELAELLEYVTAAMEAALSRRAAEGETST
ncbi:MarR family winged helix-turn-helix transcriptional regulator [Embleya sp. NPDC008237]|uniref:MarR family winged helix-turn-helix transcriptional regulator n=1 Tax=Embleya sp. NPDC008237 TaxID=3363978 RepID=UPI0036E746F5